MYEPPSHRSGPVPLARVVDENLVREVASAAVQQAESSARFVAGIDAVLGEARRDEAARLRRILARLLPGTAAVQ